MQPAFYADWTFWAFMTSGVAVVLSQLPPTRTWFRKPRLVLEVNDRIVLAHMIGYTNTQLYLSIRNEGTRPVRIKRINLAFQRHGRHTETLTAQSYFSEANGSKPVMFFPFRLNADAEWSHTIWAFETLVAKDDQTLGMMRSQLRRNIAEKVSVRNASDPTNKDLITADDQALGPVLETFGTKFNLAAGEYHVSVTVLTDRDLANVSATYRFTIYDPDSEQLKGYVDNYKYGFGPAIDDNRQAGITCQLHPDSRPGQ